MKKLIKIMVPLALVVVMVFAMAGVAFAASATFTITGSVLDEKGQAIEGASVEAWYDIYSATATTAADGTYSITFAVGYLPPDDFPIIIEVKASEYKDKTETTFADHTGGTTNISAPAITLEKKKTTYTVTGKVLDKDGKPMEGADVTMGTQSITTDADGIFSADFEMDFSSGGGITFRLKISKEGYVPWEQNQSISASSPTTIDIGTVSLRAYASSEEATPADTPTPTQAPDSTKSPKTGGEADAALFLMLMGIAAAGIALSAAALRKHAKSAR